MGFDIGLETFSAIIYKEAYLHGQRTAIIFTGQIRAGAV